MADRHPRALIAASILCFGTVGAALFVLEVPGLGIAHLIYLPVAFMALATSARAGAAAGAFATLGYLALSVLSPRLGDVRLLTVSTAVIAVTSVAFGALIGWIADSKRRLLAQLHELAQRDFLSGLLNLRAFEDALNAYCEVRRPFALLLADLDGLKAVNDREGHHAGNLRLRDVAAALLEELQEADRAARVGGDEFAVLLPAVASPDEAESAARRLERRLERRGLWLSFGWAVYPADGEQAIVIFRRADQRLYSSKLGRAQTRSDRGTRQPLRPLPTLRAHRRPLQAS
jgi:diguanylate cyclase (GGDEF)-like protein